jgi:uncharacterized protein with HEPN domain
LPHGGAVNIRGEIVWRITKEELEEMKERVMSIFDDITGEEDLDA